MVCLIFLYHLMLQILPHQSSQFLCFSPSCLCFLMLHWHLGNLISISSMNKDFAQASGPISNVWALSWDSNARSVISFISSNPSIFEKILSACALALNCCSSSGTSCCGLSFLIKPDTTHHLLLPLR